MRDSNKNSKDQNHSVQCTAYLCCTNSKASMTDLLRHETETTLWSQEGQKISFHFYAPDVINGYVVEHHTVQTDATKCSALFPWHNLYKDRYSFIRTAKEWNYGHSMRNNQNHYLLFPYWVCGICQWFHSRITHCLMEWFSFCLNDLGQNLLNKDQKNKDLMPWFGSGGLAS